MILRMLTLVLPLLAFACAATGEPPATASTARPSIASRIWWNNPDIATVLHLSTAQRSRMDAALGARLPEFRSNRQQRHSAQAAVGEQLEKGDWAAARTAGAVVSGLAGNDARLQVELKIDVLTILSSDQLRELGQKYPHLLRQPWVRMVGTRGNQ